MSRTAPDLAADRTRALALVPVSRETSARLDRFVALLLQWQQRTNLIGAATVPQLWTRHIADSLQLLALAPEARVWVDLGSGGGFPGAVIACALTQERGAAVHLVESNTKKAAFLREVVRAIGLPAIVHAERIEHFSVPAGTHVDVVTARALAPLNVLFGYVAPLLKTGAQALLPKGQDVEAELTEATKYWNIEPRLHSSRTGGQGWIVELDAIERRTASAD